MALEINLFGPFEARANGAVLAIRSRRAQALMAMLVLAPSAAIARDRLAATLWPDRSETQAKASLRQELSTLRRCLGDAADVEREAGWTLAAHHSIHQLALLTAPGGSLARLKSYYRETFDTLRRTQNHQGAGLCLRSLGELAWLSPKPEQAVTFWRSGAKRLARVGVADEEQLRRWAELAQPEGVG